MIMMFAKVNLLALLLLLLVLVRVEPLGASRILYEEGHELMMKKELVLQSLQKAPVPPSGSSGCTNIPGRPGPSCPLNEMHYAGQAKASTNMNTNTNTYPPITVPFGVVTSQK